MKVVDRKLCETLFRDLADELARPCADHQWWPLCRFWIFGIAPGELQRELELARIDVLDGEGAEPAVLEHVNARPVGNPRHRHLHHGGERAAVVERAAERRARLNEEPLCLLGPLLVVDVGVRPEPLDHLAVPVLHRDGTGEMPAIRAVTGTSKTELVLVRPTGIE
jgi:hypothetical protein